MARLVSAQLCVTNGFAVAQLRMRCAISTMPTLAHHVQGDAARQSSLLSKQQTLVCAHKTDLELLIVHFM